MATRVADEDHVDPGLVGDAGARRVVGGDHHERVGSVADLAGADRRRGDACVRSSMSLLSRPAPLGCRRSANANVPPGQTVTLAERDGTCENCGREDDDDRAGHAASTSRPSPGTRRARSRSPTNERWCFSCRTRSTPTRPVEDDRSLTRSALAGAFCGGGVGRVSSGGVSVVVGPACGAVGAAGGGRGAVRREDVAWSAARGAAWPSARRVRRVAWIAGGRIAQAGTPGMASTLAPTAAAVHELLPDRRRERAAR